MNDCKNNVCITVPKVYDWVRRKVKLLLIKFDGHDDDPCDKFDDICINEICKFLKKHPGFQVCCKLIDNSIICQEVGKHPLRQNISRTLSTDETAILQKVKVLIKGLVEITILDAQGNVMIVSDGIPFSTTQTFLLCAPEGTDLKCKITYSKCESEFICTDEIEKLEISILLCLDIQVEADVKVTVEAEYCKPRRDKKEIISEPSCILPNFIFPPQCPSLKKFAN